VIQGKRLLHSGLGVLSDEGSLEVLLLIPIRWQPIWKKGFTSKQFGLILFTMENRIKGEVLIAIIAE